MGKCDLCGQDAGFFQTRHNECQARYNFGVEQILNSVQAVVMSRGDLTLLRERLYHIASNSFINDVMLKSLIAKAWERAVDQCLEDNILTVDEERALMEFKEFFALSQQDLDRNGALGRVVKNAIIRDVLEGKIPNRVRVDGPLPFNLQKDETIIWLFHNVKYYEQRTRTRYVGGYSGLSFRVAKGVYYRIGGFRGNPIQTTETVHVDTGTLVVTNKHIYFAGSAKAFKIRYDQIVSFTPYSDGIGVQRNALTAIPQLFQTGDGWFSYNLLTNLARMAGD